MGRIANRFIMAWVGVLLLAAHATAQEDRADRAQANRPAQFGERPKHASRATAMYKANLEKYQGAGNMLVLPGLVADRKTRRVEVMAEATGIEPGTIVEFLLIDAGSGKGYEALLWSHARPSDIHRALEFIGMKPGKPFHPGKLRFWPKGERVVASVAAAGDDAKTRLESLVIDKGTGRSLAEVGFVFTGSLMVNPPGKPTQQAYAADVIDPKSVASLYNDSTAVLDVPRRALQGAVYGTQVAGISYDFGKHDLVTVTLEPEHKDGRRRVMDLTLAVRPATATVPGGSGPSLPIEFLLADAAGKAMTEKPQLTAVLGVFSALVRQGRDPFVSVRFDPALRLAEVAQVCKFIDSIDSERGIRVEPPAAGQLYYEALLPDRELLSRGRRIVDPWEVHLKRHGEEEEGEITATLTLHESTFVAGKLQTRETSFDVETPDLLRRQLDADAARRKADGRRPGPPVLLVFVDADVTYGRMIHFLAPAMTTHNMVHVFVDSEP